MKCCFKGVRVRGIAACLPAQRLELRSLATLYGEAETTRIISSTGIEAVRVAPPDVTTADLCLRAAEGLITELGVDRTAVGGLVFASQTPDHVLPGTSSLLQHRLGLSNDTLGVDLTAGCAGYIQGLIEASMLVSTGLCKSVLVCAGDTMTRYVHPNDRSVRMVFGDAGSATLVEAGPGEIRLVLHTDGSLASKLMIPAGGCRLPRSSSTGMESRDAAGNVRTAEHIYMDGAEIMNFVLDRVPPLIDEILNFSGWNKEDVGLYALHQANKFMVEYLAKKSRLPRTSTPLGLRDTGNTGPASIPLLLTVKRSELGSEQLQRSVLCGFGSGLVWAACGLDLSGCQILPTMELN